MWCGREKSYNFLAEPVVVFPLMLAVRKVWSLLNAMSGLDSASITIFLHSFWTSMASSCANLSGVQGGVTPSVLVSLNVHFQESAFRKKVLDIVKLLEMQKSISICRFSLCSSGSS